MSADQYDTKKPALDPNCPNCGQRWPADDPVSKSALEYFTAYFEKNYNGTVVFSDPRWHAPKVFRAALWAIKQTEKDALGKTAALDNNKGESK